jgi:hypothetical protein
MQPCGTLAVPLLLLLLLLLLLVLLPSQRVSGLVLRFLNTCKTF